MKQYIIRLSVFSIIMAILSFLVIYYFFSEYELQIVPYIFFYFVGITYSMQKLLYKNLHKNNVFVRLFMGIVGAKLLLSLTFIAIYLFFNRENALPFLILFLAYYLSFSAFELFSIMKMVKKK